MTLSEAIDRARLLTTSGDPEGAASVLNAAIPSIQAEEDLAVLLRFADGCHDWGHAEAEEAALRAALHRGPHLEILERLLDLLQQRLNELDGEARVAVVAECEQLGAEALRVLPETGGLRWANLIHPRGLRRLELAQAGHHDRIAGARADIEAYRSWLERNEQVPSHLQRANLMALADVELAELDLLEERRDDAARRLESAIGTLEAAKAPQWWIDHAYSVLERAYA